MKYDKEIIIRLKKKGKTWDEIGEVFDTSGENVRAHAKKQDWFDEIREEHKITDAAKDTIDKKTEDRKTGEITSEIKRKMREKKVLTDDELLELHALDPKCFQIRTITSNEWTMTESGGEQWFNFQSKIVAEPIKQKITPEFIKNLFLDVQPSEVNFLADEVLNTYLLLPFADWHWGLNNTADYEVIKSKIADRLLEGHREVVFVLLGDFFHVDNLLNTTVRGTRVDDVDVEQATQDAYQFMIDMLKLALEQSPCVKLVYLQGNHDSMTGYMFVQGIKRMFPDVEIDDSTETLKHTWVGGHSVFLHHGDKITDRRLLGAITGKFPKEWGEGKQRYLITGHKHHEKSLDLAGITHYQVATPSKATKFEDDYGYNGTEQVQMLFRFDDEKRDAIYYL